MPLQQNCFIWRDSTADEGVPRRNTQFGQVQEKRFYPRCSQSLHHWYSLFLWMLFCYRLPNLESQVERLEINWKLKTKSRTVQGICRRAFCAAYDIGNTALTEICAEIKVSQIDSILCLYQIALLSIVFRLMRYSLSLRFLIKPPTRESVHQAQRC